MRQFAGCRSTPSLRMKWFGQIAGIDPGRARDGEEVMIEIAQPGCAAGPDRAQLNPGSHR
ncbi:MAG TPA: hypothetical protein VLM38_25155 [Blastocatellia bacterium]|nr:hypothetical protein [Blastocatellia bacterium]